MKNEVENALFMLRPLGCSARVTTRLQAQQKIQHVLLSPLRYFA